jgi:hypothetical protein
MKKGILILFITSAVLFAYSCKKKNEQPNPSTATPLEFTSLVADSSAILTGETSTITATAKGDNLTYTWAMSHGDLFGSGSTVFYGAQSCCVGINTVSCTVTGSGSSITKTTTIEVLQSGH